MESQERNIAYIDGSNLHKGISELGWELNYGKFRKWLEERYNVSKAYIFIGLVPAYKKLYTSLQESGFTLIFKETLPGKDGTRKGNYDC